MMSQTHTYSLLSVKPEFFYVIRQALKDAGYDHAIHGDVLDMHGIALKKEKEIMNYKFRKKPVVIEAFQMTRERRISNVDWPPWLNEAWNRNHNENGAVIPTINGVEDCTLSVRTLEGLQLVSWDDWIIRGVEGELYPCKPSVFEKTYEIGSGDNYEEREE